MSVDEGSRWPEALVLTERLVADAAGSVVAVLLYGSRLLRTNPDAHSALDFVVIVESNRSFYEGLSKSGELQRPPGLMTALAKILAPNVLAYAPDDGRNGLAKCLVVNRPDFARAVGPNPPDHFILGRLVQQTGVLWTRDEEAAQWVQTQIAGAHMRVLEWMAPYLEGPVDAQALGRRMLEVCYAGEIRPESQSRAGHVFEAQADHFASALTPVLEESLTDGVLVKEGDRYALATPVPPAERRRWRRHFRWSKTRTTLRWFKHSVTFANWLTYATRKVERHTGRTIRLTALERGLPLIFIWPRVFHVLLTRPRREIQR